MSVYLRNTKKVAVAKRRDNLTLYVLVWMLFFFVSSCV